MGVVFAAKVGTQVNEGTTRFTLHAADKQSFDATKRRLLDAYTWSDTRVDEPPLFHGVVGGSRG